MPYTDHNDPKLPDNVKRLSPTQRKRWVAIWNKTFADCGERKSCEAAAFQAANGVIRAEEQFFIGEQFFIEGGPGSGNWGHAGVKGVRGGSAPTLSTTRSKRAPRMSLRSGPSAKARAQLARDTGKSGGTQKTGGMAFPSVAREMAAIQAKKNAKLKAERERARRAGEGKASTDAPRPSKMFEEKINEHQQYVNRINEIEAELATNRNPGERLALLKEKNQTILSRQRVEREITEQARVEIDKISGGDNAKMVTPRITGIRKNKAEVERGTQEFSRMLSPEYGLDQATVRIEGTGRNRSFYESSDNTVHITTKPWSPRQATVHELGHWLEERHPKVREAAQQFLGRRTQGERPSWLGRGYSKKEVAKKDSFMEPYMGKIYPRGSTEIISMGLEYMFRNAGKFIATDPDYADFIFAIMNGKGYL